MKRKAIAAQLVELAGQLVEAEQWSGDVKTKWHPPEGFFEQSAVAIAKGLKGASKDLKQAMSRLTFYINRAGKNLSADDKARLENAKKKLSALYEKTARPKRTRTQRKYLDTREGAKKLIRDMVDWGAKDKVRVTMDPQVHGTWLAVNDTKKQAVVLYLFDEDFEDAEYAKALKYFKYFK